MHFQLFFVHSDCIKNWKLWILLSVKICGADCWNSSASVGLIARTQTHSNRRINHNAPKAASTKYSHPARRRKRDAVRGQVAPLVSNQKINNKPAKATSTKNIHQARRRKRDAVRAQVVPLLVALANVIPTTRTPRATRATAHNRSAPRKTSASKHRCQHHRHCMPVHLETC